MKTNYARGAGGKEWKITKIIMLKCEKKPY